jgi:hypothetical protein
MVWNGAQAELPRIILLFKKKKLTFAEVKSATNLHSFFHLPLSVQAFSQLGQLQSILQRTQVSNLFDIYLGSLMGVGYFFLKESLQTTERSL